MLKRYFFIFLLIGISCFFVFQKNKKLDYPETPKQNKFNHYFGNEVLDPYQWLENLDSVETISWLQKQNQFTETFFSNLETKSRKEFKNELAKSINYDRYELPRAFGDTVYFFVRKAMKEKIALYRNIRGIDSLIFDFNGFLVGDEFVTRHTFSNNGRYVAIQITERGGDENRIQLFDLKTHKFLPDKINHVRMSNISWDKNGFYYAKYDSSFKSGQKVMFQKVFYHRVNSAGSNDKLIYKDPKNADKRFYVMVNKFNGDLIISTYNSSIRTGEVLCYNGKKFIEVVSDTVHFKSLIHVDNKSNIYLRTNWDAGNNKLVRVNVNQPNIFHDVINETKNRLQSVEFGGGNFYAKYLVDVHQEVIKYDMSGKVLDTINLPGFGLISGFSGEIDDSIIYYSYSSMNQPKMLYSYNKVNDKSNIFKQVNLPEYNSKDYIVDQVFYKSFDGTKVPMFIARHKDIKGKGNHPIILTAYGAHGTTMLPSFNPTRAIWLKNGGMYAIANIRGGGEYGEEWHKAGSKLNKKNGIMDVIYAANYIYENISSKDNLVLSGYSSGGMLMAAAINYKPDICKAAVIGAGTLDLLKYHLFNIGYTWKDEYGYSEESAEVFEYLYSYSPYHNVKKHTSYPNILIYTNTNDDRVYPAFSYKYAAVMQEMSTINLVLLRTVESESHSGLMREELINTLNAELYSFCWNHVGNKN